MSRKRTESKRRKFVSTQYRSATSSDGQNGRYLTTAHHYMPTPHRSVGSRVLVMLRFADVGFRSISISCLAQNRDLNLTRFSVKIAISISIIVTTYSRGSTEAGFSRVATKHLSLTQCFVQLVVHKLQ